MENISHFLDILLNEGNNKEKFKASLEKYKYIMDNVADHSDKDEFKEVYYNFYLKVGRTVINPTTKVEAYNGYFNILKKILNGKSYVSQESLIGVISDLKNLTNRNEFSFATKLLHTINPELPIYDSRVRGFLSKLEPKVINASMPKKEDKIVIEWEKLINWYAKFQNSSEGKEWINWFDYNFSDYAEISTVKKIDFIMFIFGKELLNIRN